MGLVDSGKKVDRKITEIDPLLNERVKNIYSFKYQ